MTSTTPAVHLANKRLLHSALFALASATTASLRPALQAIYAPDAQWRGSHPMNELQGRDAIESLVWRPLLQAFPDLERRDEIVIGGHYDDADQVAMLGHLCGTFRHSWLGIPSTGRPAWIRYGEVHAVVDGQITRSTVLFDVLDVIRQAGFWPVPSSLGTEGLWPGPLLADGLVFDKQDEGVSAASLAQTLAMQQTLADGHDARDEGRAALLEMGKSQHWHPKMMWYGPSGIGSTRGLQGFVDYHQLPFRKAFAKRRGGQHFLRIGDGAYSATAGWPAVSARHSGGGFLGTSPTGRDVELRLMNFHRHDEGLIRENWLPLDVVHLLLQLGVDVFERMESHFRRG